MMSDLMYRGRRGTVAFTVEGRAYYEVVCLCPVDLIVVRLTFERRFDLGGYDESEDGHFVVNVTLEILQLVIADVEKHIPEEYAGAFSVSVARGCWNPKRGGIRAQIDVFESTRK